MDINLTIETIETIDSIELCKVFIKEIHKELNRIEKANDKEVDYKESENYFKVLNIYNSVVNRMNNLLVTDKL
jgi:hypothetical protein